MKDLIEIIKLLKPKYYNKITYLLVICGTSILTKPLWLDIVNWGIETTDKNYKTINIPLIGAYDWIIGLFLIIISLVWNTYNRYLDIKSENVSEPAYKKIKQLKFDNFEQICQTLYPILKDNEYIFKTVGPNSGAESTDELRIDLTLWYKYRSESIAPNNEKIKQILIENINIFDREFKLLVDRMILHIDAFEEHLKNEMFDYSQHRFPVEFMDKVELICFETASNSRNFRIIHNWLNKKLKFKVQDDWFVFGSSIFNSEKSKDFDVVIYLDSSYKSKFSNKLDNIMTDFKLKFKKNLHLTVFNIDEKAEFEKFIEHNKFKVNKNG